MNKERRLGRGLEALLGRVADANDATPQPTTAPAPVGGIPRVELAEIDSNPFQPRQAFDNEEITQLAESMKEHGLIQAIVVRRSGDRYQLISGERRLRAARLAGWQEIPAQIREVDDRQLAEVAIVENLQRKDLNPIEKAASFRDYLSRYGCTQEDLASRLKIDRSTIANLIRLLDLPEEIQAWIRAGRLTQGHARALLPLAEQEAQLAMARRILREGLSVRAIESLAQEQSRDGASRDATAAADPQQADNARRGEQEHLVALEQELRSALGTKVSLVGGTNGRGKIVVHFSSHEEFERLRQLFCNGVMSHRSAG